MNNSHQIEVFAEKEPFLEIREKSIYITTLLRENKISQFLGYDYVYVNRQTFV